MSWTSWAVVIPVILLAIVLLKLLYLTYQPSLKRIITNCSASLFPSLHRQLLRRSETLRRHSTTGYRAGGHSVEEDLPQVRRLRDQSPTSSLPGYEEAVGMDPPPPSYASLMAAGATVDRAPAAIEESVGEEPLVSEAETVPDEGTHPYGPDTTDY
jgi:hypothetical protein